MRYFISIFIPLIRLILCIIPVSFPDILAAESSVKVWQDSLVIPTYRVGEPERNPIFYFGRAYQGAKGPVYPYPFLDVLTDIREDKKYSALYLENEFVKICVLPEIGGRIFEAVDKTNGYNFFYRQQVIKPALIGMLGAWISGGVEWNIPHHHRATTFMPIDWTTAENPDGSKTIWIGEMELRHRMKWIVGLTLHPGSSVLEVSYRIFNRTPSAHSILCWANTAVHANENYQVFFPPGTSLATFHGKNQFARWPVSREVYNGVDYTRGVDISWWKNHPSPTSFFAWESREDFFAGYDHGWEAGVVFVADHSVSPGKKLWTWGTGSEGQRWEKILTDADGPYLELMFGAFSDNQPDYSWAQPYETKTVTQWWYPLRGIGGVKNANARAACNLEVMEGGKVFIGLAATSSYKGASVLLKAGEKIILERKVEMSPANPFSEKILLPAGAEQESLRLSLFNADGIELISYQPKKAEEPTFPEPVTPPPFPAEIKTSEELYLAGLRLEQFYNPALEPYPYYEEALKRDPGDSRVNTALGRLLLQRGLYEEAEAKLRRTVQRLTKKYTRPKDGEALYYLGLALRARGKNREALEALALASWSEAWSAAACYEMAELAAEQGDLQQALELSNHSLAWNKLNAKAMNLGTASLRKMGRLEEAEKRAAQTLSLDPLDFWAANELTLIKSDQRLQREAEKLTEDLELKMRGASQDYLELAADYGRCGFWDEAVSVLSRFISGKNKTASNPLVYYGLAYYWDRKGRPELAREYCLKASGMPPEYGFPFQLEFIPILRRAEEINPKDARAPYYLGNLLFDRQPERAIEEWEKSIARDNSFATAHRNLGIAYSRVKNDLPRAVVCLEKAVACDSSDPRLYFELDQLYDLAAVTPQKRLELLAKNHAVVAKRDDSLSREIALLVELGNYDRAVELLKSHHFHIWEGGGEIHGAYVDAHLLRGQKFFQERQYRRALLDFKAALDYPENLEVGRPAAGGRSAEIEYFIGQAHEALEETRKAKESYRRSAGQKIGPSELTYYQGLSWQRLGEKQNATDAFDSLIQYARQNLEKSQAMDYFAKFGEKESAQRRKAYFHYLAGLGLLGKGQKVEAGAEFQIALGLHPHYFRAQRQLASLS